MDRESQILAQNGIYTSEAKPSFRGRRGWQARLLYLIQLCMTSCTIMYANKICCDQNFCERSLFAKCAKIIVCEICNVWYITSAEHIQFPAIYTANSFTCLYISHGIVPARQVNAERC